MPADERISVYIVDDQSIVRGALRCLLTQSGSIAIVGDSGSAREALKDLKTRRPDVILLDITMPGLSGLDAIPLIKKVAPKANILMLSVHEGASRVEQAMSMGADGYLSKDSEPSELVLAVNSVRKGNPYLSPRIARNFLPGQRNGRAGAAATSIDSLTPRERQVFQMLAIGKSNKEVAQELHISLGTAKKHRENLRKKLQCGTSSDLVRLAIREGLLEV
jgi:DNA-binding NarL/FixJ family response regulator